MEGSGWDVVFDVLENQFLKVLHQNVGECHRVVVSRRDTANFLSTGTMVAIMKQVGTLYCYSEMLKMSVMTSTR